MKLSSLCLLMISIAVSGMSVRAQSSDSSADAGTRDVLAQEKRDTDEAIALIREMLTSKEPAQWFDVNKTRLTHEVANTADEIARQALSNNRPNTAIWALTLANLAHSHLGQPVRALGSEFLRTQALFMVATKPEEYASVRRSALVISDRASKLGEMELMFKSAVLAADSSYFRSGAASQNTQRGELLAETLTDISNALPLLRHAGERIWLERFVSVTAAAVSDATRELFLAQEQIDAALKQLAPEVEQAVPVDFAYNVEQIGEVRKSIATARTLAHLSYLHGNAVVASARLAVAAQRAVAVEDPGLTVAVIQERYIGERHAGASPQRLRQLRNDAWTHAQNLRAGYRSRSGRIWASYLTDELFGVMLEGELADESSRPVAAFSHVESMKARMLLDRLATPRAQEVDSEMARELERQILAFNKPRLDDNSLTLAEMRLVSQLSGFDSIGGRDAERGVALQKLEALYRSANAGYREPAKPASLQAVQMALAPDEALLEYVIPYNTLHPARDLWIMLITRDAIRRTHVDLDQVLPPVTGFIGRLGIDGEAPVDSSALGNLIVTTRTAIRSADEKLARSLLTGLHKLLIDPLKDLGFRPESYRRLVIVPHGALHYVPFAALLDENHRFLIETTEIVVAPSASVWQRLGTRSGGADKFVAFANPDLSSRGVADLPFSDQEVVEIVKAMPSPQQVFRARNASKARLIAEAPNAGVLHLATHGEFPDENAVDVHSIWLADDNGRSAALSAAEVRQMPLSETRLVVLSVCNGGLYRIGPADEPYGLLPAFLEAGVQNVIGTLWPLDDQFGRDFMIEFYKHLEDGASGALRKASLRFIEEDEYLRRWAAFILVGSGRLNASMR